MVRMEFSERAMPYSIKVEQDSGIGIVAASGELSAHEIERAYTELWADPSYNGSTVWDLRAGSIAELSQDDAQRVIGFVQRERPPLPLGRIAYVAPRDVDFGVARMMESLVAGIAVRPLVTRDFEHALAWVTGRS